jgi:hypothetical protein
MNVLRAYEFLSTSCHTYRLLGTPTQVCIPALGVHWDCRKVSLKCWIGTTYHSLVPAYVGTSLALVLEPTLLLTKPNVCRPPDPGLPLGYRPELHIQSNVLAFKFAGIHVEAEKIPATNPLTARQVFETFHSLHENLTSSETGDALLKMDTSAPAQTTAKQIYDKARRLHNKVLQRSKAGKQRDSFLAGAKWSWPGNDKVSTLKHNTARTHTHTPTHAEPNCPHTHRRKTQLPHTHTHIAHRPNRWRTSSCG